MELEHAIIEIYLEKLTKRTQRPLGVQDQQFVLDLVIVGAIAMGERVLDRQLPAVDTQIDGHAVTGGHHCAILDLALLVGLQRCHDIPGVAHDMDDFGARKMGQDIVEAVDVAGGLVDPDRLAARGHEAALERVDELRPTRRPAAHVLNLIAVDVELEGEVGRVDRLGQEQERFGTGEQRRMGIEHHAGQRRAASPAATDRDDQGIGDVIVVGLGNEVEKLPASELLDLRIVDDLARTECLNNAVKRHVHGFLVCLGVRERPCRAGLQP